MDVFGPNDIAVCGVETKQIALLDSKYKRDPRPKWECNSDHPRNTSGQARNDKDASKPPRRWTPRSNRRCRFHGHHCRPCTRARCQPTSKRSPLRPRPSTTAWDLHPAIGPSSPFPARCRSYPARASDTNSLRGKRPGKCRGKEEGMLWWPESSWRHTYPNFMAVSTAPLWRCPNLDFP